VTKKPVKTPTPKFSSRFGDWDPADMIHVNPGERVVPDKDSKDPAPLANVGGFGDKESK
jgi:hypothetical protein